MMIPRLVQIVEALVVQAGEQIRPPPAASAFMAAM